MGEIITFSREFFDLFDVKFTYADGALIFAHLLLPKIEKILILGSGDAIIHLRGEAL